MTPAKTSRLLRGVLMLGLVASLFASACGASVKQTDPNTAANSGENTGGDPANSGAESQPRNVGAESQPSK